MGVNQGRRKLARHSSTAVVFLLLLSPLLLLTDDDLVNLMTMSVMVIRI